MAILKDLIVTGASKFLNGLVSTSGQFDTLTTGGMDVNKTYIHYLTGTGTAAVTSNPYNYAKWDATDETITSLYDGLVVAYKIPVAGNGTYGTCLQINSLGYHPVVQVVNGMISTRYGVNSVIFMIYDSTVSGTVYNNSGSSSTIAGVWRVVNDYDSGNTTNQLNNASGKLYAGTAGVQPYTLVALDNVGRYQSLITSAKTGTATGKTINTSGKFMIEPVLYYYGGNNTNANGAVVTSAAAYSGYPNFDTRYSHNYTTTFTTHTSTYIECTVTDGYWSPTDVCITQTFRAGYYYIYLGNTYSTAYQVSLTPQHPMYYYDGTNFFPYSQVINHDVVSSTEPLARIQSTGDFWTAPL